MDPFKVAIIDDNILCRQLLMLQLAAIETIEIEVVFQTDTLVGIQDRLSTDTKIDLFLLDIMMPEIDGITGIGILKEMFPRIPIFMVSDVQDQAVIQQCIVAGAQAFIPKGSSVSQLMRTLIGILMNKEHHICPKLTKSIYQGIHAQSALHIDLSVDELELVDQVFQGKSLEVISEILERPFCYVQSMILEVLRKMKLPTNACYLAG